MQCTKCGATVADTDRFCPECGEKLPEVYRTTNLPPEPQSELPSEPQHGLKWANCLCYFLLWYSTLGHIVTFTQNARNCLAALKIPASPDYRIFWPPYILTLVTCLVCAVLNVFTAIAIIRRKKSSIVLAPLVYLIPAVSSIIRIIIFLSLTVNYSITFIEILSIAVSIAMGIVNIIYFKRRATIFSK